MKALVLKWSLSLQVQYKNEQGAAFVNDEQIKGLLMVSTEYSDNYIKLTFSEF